MRATGHRRRLASAAALALLAACGSGGDDDPGADTSAADASSAGPDAAATGGVCPTTTLLERAPACGGEETTTVLLPAGCTPVADGLLHAEEWDGAACFDVGGSGDVVHAKIAEGALHLAFSATPSCGCPMSFAFDPGGAEALDGDEFLLRLFDDPFESDGDRVDMVVDGGEWTAGAAPAGIVTMCPGDNPSPINYEIAIPLAALAISGSDPGFRFAFDHPTTASWPAGLTLDEAGLPVEPGSWGTITLPSPE